MDERYCNFNHRIYSRYRSNTGSNTRKYRHFENLIGIIDCLEVFIKTQKKKLELQSATWSEYKH